MIVKHEYPKLHLLTKVYITGILSGKNRLFGKMDRVVRDVLCNMARLFFCLKYEHIILMVRRDLDIKLTDVANQRLLDAFLAQEDNQQLYQRVLNSLDDTQRNDELESRFLEFYDEVRFTKFISSLIRFTAIELAVRNKRTSNACQPTDEIERVIDSLVSDSDKSEREDNFDWKDVLADKRILDAVQTLTEKEQEMLTLLYLRNLKEAEAASLLVVSQQAVSKTKKRALLKLRKQLEGGGGHEPVNTGKASTK
ncbi:MULTISPECIES: sigma-70 family RNA polymerase sigma factor [Brevibacillus]|nr:MULTISPECIES: sigma-70 family RNA polymerase sigma factor [Brevibacillus]MED1944892.1 sigma-70 family RNA polymerase sigma factor [Brevibacillus formosus]MED1996421.1 sigma-70 family RNA polymerase sigma factor [Brevibacillus formosus]MED2081390.1 sigma-70 family RNA polymerase sigma factor [Brevibacillus formosus]